MRKRVKAEGASQHAASTASSRHLRLLLLLQGRGGGEGGQGMHSSNNTEGAGVFSPHAFLSRKGDEATKEKTSGSPPSSSSATSEKGNRSLPLPFPPASQSASSSSSPPHTRQSSDPPPLEGQCEVFEGEEGMDVRFTVRALQSNLRCRLCGGFFREAVTIKDCLHTFCKWCLYTRAARQEFEETGCPRCEEKLRHSLPYTNGT